RERARFLNPLVLPSVSEIERQGKSLGLIRPLDARFLYRPKSAQALAEEREAYAKAARQGSLLDGELDALVPTPFEFKFRFSDSESKHNFTNGDWEAHAMYYN